MKTRRMTILGWLVGFATSKNAFAQKIPPTQIQGAPGPAVNVWLSFGGRNVIARADPATLKYDPTTNTLSGIGSAPATVPTPVEETPIGVMDGANLSFTVSAAPVNGILDLFLNGVRQDKNMSYTLSGTTITFTPAATPSGPGSLVARYSK